MIPLDSWGARAANRPKKEVIEPVSPGLATLVADFPWPSAAVTGVTSGAAGAGSFQIAGDSSSLAGSAIWVVGSAGNDGGYRVSTATYNAGTGLTTLDVYEAVPDATADGTITWPIPANLAIAAVTAGSAGSGAFAVAGNYVASFLPGWQIEVGRSAHNIGTYTIRSAPSYDSGTDRTTFPVSEAVPSSTVDGYLRAHYPAPQDSRSITSFPAGVAAGIERSALEGTPQPTVPAIASSPARRIAPVGDYVPRGSLVTAQRSGNNWLPILFSRQRFLYAGGSVTRNEAFSGGPFSHYRIDPNTGATLWAKTRGTSSNALCCDELGYVYTCGITASGSTHEKWDSDGNKVWGADAGHTVAGMAVDRNGFVYTAVNPGGGSHSQILKWDPTGNPIASGGWPVTLVSSLPINALAVDPVDGRVAAAFGSAVHGGVGIFLSLFASDGSPLALTAGSSSSSQLSAAFDWQGRLYGVGMTPGSGSSFTFGDCYDYQGNWTGQLPPVGFVIATGFQGYSVATDGLGRVYFGNNYPLNSVIAGQILPPYTLTGATVIFPGETKAFWRQIAEGGTVYAVAADVGGTVYALCTGYQQAEYLLEAFDPLGALRWKSGIWRASGGTFFVAAV